MADNEVRPALVALDEEGDEWTEEIQEAEQARKQKLEWLAKHPRPVPPRAMMQRSPSHQLTQNRARFIMPTMPIDTTARS